MAEAWLWRRCPGCWATRCPGDRGLHRETEFKARGAYEDYLGSSDRSRIATQPLAAGRPASLPRRQPLLEFGREGDFLRFEKWDRGEPRLHRRDMSR